MGCCFAFSFFMGAFVELSWDLHFESPSCSYPTVALGNGLVHLILVPLS